MHPLLLDASMEAFAGGPLEPWMKSREKKSETPDQFAVSPPFRYYFYWPYSCFVLALGQSTSVPFC